MTPQRLVRICAATVAVVGVAYLLGWWMVWRVLLLQPIAEPLHVMPLSAVGCLLIAGAMFAAQSKGARRWVLGLSAVAAVLALVIFGEHLFNVVGGLERHFFGSETVAVLGGPHPGRPSPETALSLGFLALAASLSLRYRGAAFEPADVGASAAAFMAAAMLVSHVYRAADGLWEPGPALNMTMVEAVLLLMLALASLALNPAGIMASYAARDDRGAARRRLLPAVVLAPLALGILLQEVLHAGMLGMSLSIALVITMMVLVMIVLMEWGTHLFGEIEEQSKSQMIERETRAKEEGMTDALTQLLNRRGWESRVRQVEEQCARENLNAAVIVIDLDGLKRINDTLGHTQGDVFIKRAGNALRIASRPGDVLARLGGDEFAYLSVGCQPEQADAVVRRLSQALQNAQVPASLGHAMRDLAGSLQAAFKEADQSMYAHKRERKARTAAAQPGLKA